MLFKIKNHTVPHFKASINAKVKIQELKCGCTYYTRYSLVWVQWVLQHPCFLYMWVLASIILAICSYETYSQIGLFSTKGLFNNYVDRTGWVVSQMSTLVKKASVNKLSIRGGWVVKIGQKSF